MENNENILLNIFAEAFFRFKMLRYRYSALDVISGTYVVFVISGAFQEVNVE